MSNRSTTLNSFMSEQVPIERWRIYVLRFALLAGSYAAIVSADLSSGHAIFLLLIKSLVFSFSVSLLSYCTERVTKSSRRILVIVVLLALLLAS
jgi:hypothetical protein